MIHGAEQIKLIIHQPCLTTEHSCYVNIVQNFYAIDVLVAVSVHLTIKMVVKLSIWYQVERERQLS